MSPGARSWATLAGVLGGMGCASSRWPDERGVPVPVSYADSARVCEAFIEALTAARAGTTLPAPRATPSFELRVRRIAEAMQTGEASAPTALDNARRWGEAAFRRPVDAWVLACGDTLFPSALTSPPVVTIAYAAAHFRPRSSATVACAIVVVSTGGADRVGAVSVGPAR